MGATDASLEADAIFTGRVLPVLGANGPPAAQPRFIVLGGQQGSGKSSLDLVELRGETIQPIIIDVIDTFVPGAELLDENGVRRVPDELERLSAEWAWKLMKRAIKSRFHVVFELASPRLALPFVQLARRQRYYTELIVLAVNRHVSLASMLDRHRRDPTQWLIRDRDHARCYASWPAYLIEAENKGYYDRVRLVERGVSPVYSNHLTLQNGTIGWNHRPEAYEQLLRHRSAPPTPAMAEWLVEAWQVLAGAGPHLKAFKSASTQQAARDAALAYASIADRGTFVQHIAEEVAEARKAAGRYDCPNFEQLSAALIRQVAAA